MRYIVKATRRRIGDEVVLVSHSGNSIFSGSGEPKVFPNRRAGQLAIAKWIDWQQGNIGFDNFRVEEVPDDRVRLDEVEPGHLIEGRRETEYVTVYPDKREDVREGHVPVVSLVGTLLWLPSERLVKDLGHIDPTSITTDKE